MKFTVLDKHFDGTYNPRGFVDAERLTLQGFCQAHQATRADADIAAQTRHLPDNATIWTGRGGRLYAVVMD